MLESKIILVLQTNTNETSIELRWNISVGDSVCPKQIGNVLSIEIIPPCDCFISQLLKEKWVQLACRCIRPYNVGKMLWLECIQVTLCNNMISQLLEKPRV
jgi:hypothetical protein